MGNGDMTMLFLYCTKCTEGENDDRGGLEKCLKSDYVILEWLLRGAEVTFMTNAQLASVTHACHLTILCKPCLTAKSF